MADQRKKQKFLKVPQFTGGKKAFNDFLKENIVYPEEAIQARVEGIVVVEFEVDDNGHVTQAKVLKGIGFGCDEEALRLVKLLKYEKVRNQGVRLRSTTKTNIHFRLPAQTMLQYSVTPEKTADKAAGAQPQPVVYNYTIEF